MYLEAKKHSYHLSYNSTPLSSEELKGLVFSVAITSGCDAEEYY